MIKNIVAAVVSILVVSTLLYATTLQIETIPKDMYGSSSAVSPYAVNTFTFSTISGNGTAADLSSPVCKHMVVYYISGAWLTTSVAPGLQIPIQGSNDNTNFVTITTWWVTTPGSTLGNQQVNNCYRYVRAGWQSSAGAWAWATPSTGRVNVQITSGGD